MKPPEVGRCTKALEGYLPRIKRALFKRSKIREKGEARITGRYKTYFNSALTDLNVIYRWKEVPTKARKGQDFDTWRHTVITANKLREQWHVTRILEPWIVNKKVWQEYKKHNEQARILGEEIEKSKGISPDKWKEISDELTWYAMKIGDPVQLFEENEPRNRVSDANDSDDGDGDDDGDDNDGIDYQSDLPSQAPTDDEMWQDIGTNTGDVQDENTPVDMIRDDKVVETPSTGREVDKATTAGQEDKSSRGASSIKPVDQPVPPHTRSAAGASLADTASKSDDTPSTKQDSSGSTGIDTRSSRAKEPTTEVPKDTSKDDTKQDNTSKDSTGPGTGSAKPKKPTGKSNRRIESDSDEDKKGKTSSSSISKKKKRSEMEKEDSQVKKNTKIGNPTKWTPVYFRNKKIRQVPSATVNIPGYKGGVSYRSIGTQTECSQRRYRFKGVNPVPINIGD